jgi:hypothetical protein
VWRTGAGGCDVNIEALHEPKIVSAVLAPDFSDEVCVKVVDGAFDSGRQRLRVVALAAEVVNPVLGVRHYEVRHRVILLVATTPCGPGT